MINLEKLKYETCQSPPPSTHTHLRGPATAPYFHLFFLIFQVPPSCGGSQNLLHPCFENGGGGGGGGRGGVQTMLYTIFIRKTNLKLDLLNLNIFGSSEYEKMAILKTVKFCFAHKKLFKTISI